MDSSAQEKANLFKGQHPLDLIDYLVKVTNFVTLGQRSITADAWQRGQHRRGAIPLTAISFSTTGTPKILLLWWKLQNRFVHSIPAMRRMASSACSGSRLRILRRCTFCVGKLYRVKGLKISAALIHLISYLLNRLIIEYQGSV